jgi:hypothetical protein
LGEYQGVRRSNLPDVFKIATENYPLLHRSSSNSMETPNTPHLPPWNKDIFGDLEFAQVLRDAERAIEGGVLPVRIPTGSSGSYFVRNLEGVCFLILLKYYKKKQILF